MSKRSCTRPPRWLATSTASPCHESWPCHLPSLHAALSRSPARLSQRLAQRLHISCSCSGGLLLLLLLLLLCLAGQHVLHAAGSAGCAPQPDPALARLHRCGVCLSVCLRLDCRQCCSHISSTRAVHPTTFAPSAGRQAAWQTVMLRRQRGSRLRRACRGTLVWRARLLGYRAAVSASLHLPYHPGA